MNINVTPFLGLYRILPSGSGVKPVRDESNDFWFSFSVHGSLTTIFSRRTKENPFFKSLIFVFAFEIRNSKKKLNDQKIVKDKISNYDKNSISFFVSFYWLLWRSMIAQYRDKSTMGMKFGQNLGTALIVGLVYLRVPWGK